MPRRTDLLPLLRHLYTHREEDVSLKALAQRSGWSRFHFHRAFRNLAGETPKQYALRLRLERAAAMLLAGDRTVFDVALAFGFASHEVFTRAFRRHFACTPVRYRVAALAEASTSERSRHVEITDVVGPCIHLYHLQSTYSPGRQAMPTLSIARVERVAQPILFIRRRIARSELPSMLAECFGKVYAHAQQAGLAIAGFPIALYVSMGPGLWTVEAALPLAKPASGDGEIEAGYLPGGPAAMAVHAGHYEQLPDTNAAIQRWIEANGLRVGGPPWEWYVTDPAQHPDPADWRTEVYWPLA